MKTDTFAKAQSLPEVNVVKQLQLLSKEDVAKILSVSTKTINNWIYKGFIPPPDIRSKRLVRWILNNLEKFLDDPIKWRDTNTNESKLPNL